MLAHDGCVCRRDVDKQRSKEHEDRQQKLAAEEAVHQHFAESLRLMKQQHQQQQQQQQHMQQQEHQRLREQQQRERDRYYTVTPTVSYSLLTTFFSRFLRVKTTSPGLKIHYEA